MHLDPSDVARCGPFRTCPLQGVCRNRFGRCGRGCVATTSGGVDRSVHSVPLVTPRPLTPRAHHTRPQLLKRSRHNPATRSRHTSDASATPRSRHISDTPVTPRSRHTSDPHLGHDPPRSRHTSVTTHLGHIGRTSATTHHGHDTPRSPQTSDTSVTPWPRHTSDPHLRHDTSDPHLGHDTPRSRHTSDTSATLRT